VDTEEKLSGILSEFARTVVTDFPIQAILDHLVVRIVDVLPVTGAGVTLIAPGTDPRYVAASDAAAQSFERLQADLGEGPCIAAYASGETVCVPSLRMDRRFPRFGPRALELGLEAVFTFPLNHGAEKLGALDVYCTESGPMEAAEMTAAQTLAGVTAAYLLNARARADLQEATEQANRNSLYDPLTGLPNRTLLLERLHHAILRARRTERLTAVLFVDIDLFKVVNDAYGLDAGDQLLVAFGERMTGRLRAADTVARLAGDEFVVLCEDIEERADVDGIASRIDLAVSGLFHLTGAEVKVTASIGIAFADGGSNAEAVLQDADQARSRAKRRGGARCSVAVT
jgi:diguanylate cyclase (GGDEF)-like protein